LIISIPLAMMFEPTGSTGSQKGIMETISVEEIEAAERTADFCAAMERRLRRVPEVFDVVPWRMENQYVRIVVELASEMLVQDPVEWIRYESEARFWALADHCEAILGLMSGESDAA
jgi:hypothetical protein